MISKCPFQLRRFNSPRLQHPILLHDTAELSHVGDGAVMRWARPWLGCVQEVLLPITHGSSWCTSCWWQHGAEVPGDGWGLVGERQGACVCVTAAPHGCAQGEMNLDSQHGC